jgi:hypothetical protein
MEQIMCVGAFLHSTTFDYGGAIHCLDSEDTSNHRRVLKNNYHAMMFVPVLGGYLVRMLYIRSSWCLDHLKNFIPA